MKALDKLNISEERKQELKYKIIDGKHIAEKKSNKLKDVVSAMRDIDIKPTIAIIQIGNDFASTKYVKNKELEAKRLGVISMVYKLEQVTTKSVIDLIKKLNDSSNVHGILVQKPLPSGMDENKIMETISPDKDVDGFHPVNVGNLHIGNTPHGRIPCTANGIIELIKTVDTIKGKKAVVIGRSNIVGKPVARLLEQENATVTLCHRDTPRQELVEELRRADIIVSAVGIPDFVDRTMLGFNQIIIDVGINRNSSGELCGDVNFKDAIVFAKHITPVPGGVGPMTISCLMENVVRCALNQNGKGDLYDFMFER